MAECDTRDKPLLEKIQDLLDRKPHTYDVTFCVGPEKKEVKALKVILKAASSVLEKEFEEKWEVAVVKNGEGIPLPDFDPAAFELFVKLTTLDSWSVKSLESVAMPPDQLLSLIAICRRYEMRCAVKNLEIVLTTLTNSFHQFKDTNEFLQLSQVNLETILSKDSLPINELGVFECALRWADFQCNKKNVEATVENIREILGECLYQIRFPTMSVIHFTDAIEIKNLLKRREIIGIYKFIGLRDDKKLSFDASQLPFKTTPRKLQQPLAPKYSTLCLTQGFTITDNPPFVCDGTAKNHYIACKEKINLCGLSFLGPIEADSLYNVTIEVKLYPGCSLVGKFEKEISAQKGQLFHFIFDEPILLQQGPVDTWGTHYSICYYLKGPTTSSIPRKNGQTLVLEEGGTQFRVEFESNQLAAILFKNL